MSKTKNTSRMPQNVRNGLGWLVTLLVPVVLVLTAVRLLLTPAYILIEYNTPAFPADPYGFTKEERIYWARISLDYLVNDEDISFLADLRFPEGQQVPPASCRFLDDCTRFYNDSELGHMQDVKEVVSAAMIVWFTSLVLLVGLGIWAWLGNWVMDYRRGLGRGGWLTAILIGSLLAFVLIAFGILFVAFHEIFFDPGTWRFYYSDSLIRLFPERFWRDTFLAVGLLAGGAGLLIGYLLREKKTKSRKRG
jgi:integral membrane protein (TIGR01906 family)